MAQHKRFADLSSLNVVLLAVLLVILAFSLYSIFGISKSLTPIEQPPLPKISLTLIKLAFCDQCFDTTQIEAYLKQLPLNITSVQILTRYNVEPDVRAVVDEQDIEARELVDQYTLSKLPAAIIMGEIDNLTLQNFERRGDALVFDKSPAPYYDTASSTLKGFVNATLVTDVSCKECSDLADILDQLKQLGVVISNLTTHDFKTSQVQQLIRAHNITRLPTLLFSKDAIEYEVFEQVWADVGSVERDGVLILRKVPPPYRELPSKKIKGLVTLTNIVDKTCDTCLNISLFKLIYTQNLGLAINKEKIIDVNTPEGKTFIDKYDITLIPTTVLSSDAEAYEAIVKAWSQAGDRAADGSFIFRNVQLLGQPYKNVTSGELVVPESLE